MRKALIEIASGLVVNLIELEDGANWKPPAGYAVIDASSGNPGDLWDGTKFVKPPPQLAPPLTLEQATWQVATAAQKLRIVGRRLGLE